MKHNYSIDEILSAVNEIKKKKKEKKTEKFIDKLVRKDYSVIPKDTLRLIEEAEKLKK